MSERDMNQSLNEMVFGIEARMTNIASYTCEKCDTAFDSEHELIEHEIYARYRRPGYCWQ